MPEVTDIKMFDWDLEIIFSDTVNVYENDLKIQGIGWFDFTFIFKRDKEKEWTNLEVKAWNEEKTAIVTLTNFHNPLWAATTKHIKIAKNADGNEIFFSISAKSLNEETDFLQATITFYKKNVSN